MLAVTQLNGFGAGGSNTVMSILRRLNMTTGLVLCLDAGDSGSYTGTGQTWSDVSGQGNHYQFGATSGSDTTDPTYVGAGLLSYMTFDGGDYFVPSGTPTFDDDWHKNNGLFSLMAVVEVPTAVMSSYHPIVSNGVGNNSTPNDGIHFSILSNNKHRLVYDSNNTAGAGGITTDSAGTITADVPNFLCSAFDESSPNVKQKLNSDASTSAAKTASTNTTSPPQVLRIGADGNAANFVGSGFKLYALAAWSGVQLTTTQMDDLLTALKRDRFQSIP